MSYKFSTIPFTASVVICPFILQLTVIVFLKYPSSLGVTCTMISVVSFGNIGCFDHLGTVQPHAAFILVITKGTFPVFLMVNLAVLVLSITSPFNSTVCFSIFSDVIGRVSCIVYEFIFSFPFMICLYKLHI